MKKHAYIIICHTDPYCLQSLVEALDDARNDIFILPDKKSDAKLTENLKSVKGRIFIVPENQRVDIRWGDISQIKAELTGFKEVLNKGDYEYIHLISGQDMPIKSQDHIHSYFKKFKKGANFIGLAQGEFNRRDLDFKTRYYFPFTKYYKNPNKYKQYAAIFARRILLKLQKISGYHRKWKMDVYKGCNWVSITTECARYLVDREREILKMFRGVFCGDEIYKQTLIMNSPLKDTIVDMNLDFAGGTRLLDWKRGNPYVWRKEDLNDILVSDALFARKFSSNVDKEVIDALKAAGTSNEELSNESKEGSQEKI